MWCAHCTVQRQRLMVQQFYQEVGALEEVMEEAAYALGDEAYSVLNQVSRAYLSGISVMHICRACLLMFLEQKQRLPSPPAGHRGGPQLDCPCCGGSLTTAGPPVVSWLEVWTTSLGRPSWNGIC